MKIFIYPNFDKSHSIDCTSKACDILSSLDCEIIMPKWTETTFLRDGVTYTDSETAASLCDIMISVGGDGTILKCAQLAAKNDKLLLGINCGRLGFMATLERDELDCLKSLITGNYTVDHRMMLNARVAYKNGDETVITALNEAVISADGRGIHDFTVLADGLMVSSLRADGLIFSTPTGASAYSLSAGGPLIEPTLDCIEFTQICPHSLFARTMLFSPEKRIEVRYKSDGKTQAVLSVDGQTPISLTEEDRVFIERADMALKLIDISGGSYFKAINSKLMQPIKQPTE